MTDEFNLIDYLTISRDKGIIIWLCNIGAEKYWNKVNTGMIDRQEDAIVKRMEEMNLLICRKQDIMILREKPDDEYLKTLKEAGFDIPTIMAPCNADTETPISELLLNDSQLQSQLKDIAFNNKEVYFVPYAVTYIEEQISANCNLRLVGAPSELNAKINDKIFCREVAEKLNFTVCQGKVCNSIDEIRQEYHKLSSTKPFFKKIIVKEPFGASGKGLYIIEEKSMLEPVLRMVSRFAKNNTNVKWLIEGWYEKKADINYQIYISGDGSVSVFSIKQQVLNNTVYIGSKMPAELTDDEVRSYKEYGCVIGKYLYSLGYTGVAGVDSFIAADNTIIPIVEINGRFTLSTYISFLNTITGGNNVVTRYFSKSSKSCPTYGEIKKILKDNSIIFNNDTKEGILIYTSGTFTSGAEDINRNHPGRIFALAAAGDEHRIDEYLRRFEDLLDTLV